MISDETIEWAFIAALGCVVIVFSGLLVTTSYGAGLKQGRLEAEQHARIECRCQCEKGGSDD